MFVLLHVRSIQALNTPRPNSELFRISLMFSGTSIWNSIPVYIKTASSERHFKFLCLKWYKKKTCNRCLHSTQKVLHVHVGLFIYSYNVAVVLPNLPLDNM